jgi:dihydrodipicolinate synthase/N-acetylneuraminate lyase
MNDATLEAYYTKLADAVDIPLILYNMPSYSGINLSVPLVAKLSLHKNIFGIKDTSNSINQTFNYHIETKGNKFDVLAGNYSRIFQANTLTIWQGRARSSCTVSCWAARAVSPALNRALYAL